MSKFLHDDDTDDAKAIAIPWVFLKTVQLKMIFYVPNNYKL